jgi:hypothetical protein
MMRDCKCPDDAQMQIGTYGNPYLMFCQCCGREWTNTPPPVELYPWEKPGHTCDCGWGSDCPEYG